ncbi:hypothetical protein EGW08_003568 [Elysia chlorotica]|uniref:Carboxypeptidase n=1 Tax=Elysia chlorotica TaxID=188477 RepID=A0A3S1BU11_ELYCH|nr:hypothetical protein EGW08_003568 [Elysia chlorotica]
MGQKMTSQSEPSEPLLLSSFLKSGKIKDAEKESRVKLHGVDLDSYSGYITVDKEHDKNLFFWFFPATKVEPTEAPLLLYLNGGPGNSSLIGLFVEVGPLRVDKDLKLHKADVSWTDKFNVIFVDNPVFVGFSYAKPGHDSRNLHVITENLFNFVNQFLQIYPKFKDCDFYIGGVMFHSYPQYLLTMGLISEKKARNLSEKLAYALDKHRLLGKHEEAVMDLMDSVFTQMHKTLGYDSLDNILITKKHEWHFEKFLNKPEVQHAIHARASQFNVQEEPVLVHMAEDFIKGVSKELKIAMENYKFPLRETYQGQFFAQVLMVSGQMDMVVSVPMVESFLHDFRWSGMSRYLAADKILWKDSDGEVAGYVTEVKNLTRVVVRKAGHRPALDQPEWTMEMMTNFLSDQSFAH